MLYIVIASYRSVSAPMGFEAAERLLLRLRAEGVNCHIQQA